MTFRAFRNALCILRSLDFYDLRQAGVIGDNEAFGRFSADPVGTVLRLDDRRAEALWRLVDARQPAELKAIDLSANDRI